jgi:hypothetical protein
MQFLHPIHAAYGARIPLATAPIAPPSTFDPNDFQEATALFMQQLQPLIANSKLDPPLDSHPPLSRELMLARLETDDWGDMYEGTQDDYPDQDYWQEQHQQEHEHIE